MISYKVLQVLGGSSGTLWPPPVFVQQAWQNPVDRHRHRHSPFQAHRVVSGDGPLVYELPPSPFIFTLHLIWKWPSSTFNVWILPLGPLGPAVKFLTRTCPPLKIVSLSLCCHATASVTIVGFPRAVWRPVEWDPVAFASFGWTPTRLV